ncbi:MAG: ABC transporter substrate-binding protein [Deltaproteobacteria bacterium]|nr:ABC transporter substrate-binding protein [Deltaproteobacteria bacterium]
MKSSVKILFAIGVAMFLAAGCSKGGDKPKDDSAKETPKPKSTAAKTGVSQDTILVGQWSPQTGPAALWGAVARGTQAYFDMINEAGGIHGRKLKLLIRDDAFQPPRTKAAVMELVEKEGVFAFVGGIGTGTGMAVKDYLAEKKVPWIGPGSGSSQWAKKPGRYLFSVYPTYETEAKALVRYLLDTAKKEKIAFLYMNDDYGKEGLVAAQAELEKSGKKLVAEVSVEMTDQDLSSHILKIKSAKPDAVILFVLPKQGAIAVGTAAKLKFSPLWASTSTLSDAPLMHKITKGLWDGVVFNCIMELPDSDKPLVAKYKAAFEKYGKPRNANEQWGIFFMAGFMFAEPFVEALKNVGPDLDREKLVEALEKIDTWNGGIGHDVTFGPDKRQGQKSVFIAKCENGKAVKIRDWIAVE